MATLEAEMSKRFQFGKNSDLYHVTTGPHATGMSHSVTGRNRIVYCERCDRYHIKYDHAGPTMNPDTGEPYRGEDLPEDRRDHNPIGQDIP